MGFDVVVALLVQVRRCSGGWRCERRAACRRAHAAKRTCAGACAGIGWRGQAGQLHHDLVL